MSIRIAAILFCTQATVTQCRGIKSERKLFVAFYRHINAEFVRKAKKKGILLSRDFDEMIGNTLVINGITGMI